MVKTKLVAIFGCLSFLTLYASPTIVSVSTDGKYTLTTDYNNHAYIYDLDNKKVKDLGAGFNPYSGYFVPNTDMYLLQKDNKKVVIFDTKNKEVKGFKVDTLVKGDAINKDLSLFAYADSKSNMYIKNLKLDKTKGLFVSWCYGKSESPYWRSNPYKGDIPNGCAHLNGELPEFKFIVNNKLISSFVSSLYIYNFDDKGIHWEEVDKNVGQTMNAIDPSGEFVYTMDSSRVGRAVKYDLQTNKVIEFTDTDKKDNFFFNLSQRDEIPKLENNSKKPNGYTNFGFIDKDKALVTYRGMSQPYLWTGLYNINDIKTGKFYKESDNNFAINNPIKYIPLVDQPKEYLSGNYPVGAYPSVSGYNRTFDTSVEAHKLVMAQANGNGIMVYNYNPKDESLKLDWVGVPPKAEKKKEDKKGWFW